MKSEHKGEELKTFDMYHFFSRKDVIAIILLVLVLIGCTVYKLLTGPSAV